MSRCGALRDTFRADFTRHIVAERALSGFDITEQNGPGHAIARASVGVTAFVGRAVKGPVNTPVAVSSFNDYQRIFGGLWQPSTLSYAIEQFFENGGRQALIVRVCNGAKPQTLSLPAGRESLTLRAISPGSRESLRASVDYDGIAAHEIDRFNLVIQRVRAPGSELVEEQEIFRRVSVRANAQRSVGEALVESQLARVVGAMPAARPDRTAPATSGAVIGYTAANSDGDDGAVLSDYDLNGSAQDGTGIFALKSAPPFSMLCVPPPARDQDVGLSTLLIAGRFCRERQALLIVDPPLEWSSALLAWQGMRSWPFRADNAVMYFPRLLAFDRLRGRFEPFPNCGAVAGMLGRADELGPAWSASALDALTLRPGLRPAGMVHESERLRLLHFGINTLQSVRHGVANEGGTRTLADGNAGTTDWRYLAPRRLALFVASCIEHGTRWTVFERNEAATWRRARAQTEAFLESLSREAAFPGSVPGEGYFVVCDERVNPADDIAAGKFNLLYGFAASKPGANHAFLVTHHANASRVTPASVSRMATSGSQVGAEIETGLMRGIIAVARRA